MLNRKALDEKVAESWGGILTVLPYVIGNMWRRLDTRVIEEEGEPVRRLQKNLDCIEKVILGPKIGFAYEQCKKLRKVLPPSVRPIKLASSSQSDLEKQTLKIAAPEGE